jgi:hypothetical protein
MNLEPDLHPQRLDINDDNDINDMSMLTTARLCLRIPRTSSSIFTPIIPRPNPISLPIITIRNKTTKRKKKVKKGDHIEKDADRRLRLKRKLEKELEKKRKKYEKSLAQQRSQFRLPPHTPRPDAIPIGSALHVLRGLHSKQGIFVRSVASSWMAETKIVAMVRMVPNDHSPRGVKGRVKFPHPVVVGGVGGKKERIAVVVEGEGGEAKRAGMIVGGKEYLEQVFPVGVG